MDKQTLSNYGWIVICVLVLAVMIALATPFGTYIKTGVESTTAGLFETENSALSLALDSTGAGPKIIEGAGQTYNSTTATTQLSFRSSADYSTFKEVKVDGEIVASENYTVTEGSTIITFTDEYAKTLLQGTHTLDIVSNVGTASCDFVSTNPLTTLTTKTWNNAPYDFYGEYIWTDGTNIYYSCLGDDYVLNGDTWNKKTWTWNNAPDDFHGFNGNDIWTDGTNIYYSGGDNQCVLNKTTSTWTTKTWTGLTSFSGNNIWTDGTNTYYSDSHILNGDTWEEKTWNGLTSFYGNRIWTDGTNIYYSFANNQYVLDVETSTWNKKVWNGLTSIGGEYIWTDGTNYYYSAVGNKKLLNYVLNGDTWSEKTWTWDNVPSYFSGLYIWTDGTNIYYSGGDSQYVFS